MKLRIRRKTNGRTIISFVFGTMMTLSLEFPSGRKP
jgi:hypothetical protein